MRLCVQDSDPVSIAASSMLQCPQVDGSRIHTGDFKFSSAMDVPQLRSSTGKFFLNPSKVT